ncbi:MAG TPA: type I-C CRISPR-associated protein Cas5c, partial [Dehalococcoidia bacterium]|nr:type I-C CRISPR-associated protein Cas5c [Dehalococcoidia bacterium]
MATQYPPVSVKVWGPLACFTRPEMKVERVSYAVMTPSAARGVLESIYWHPGVTWRVEEIMVLTEIRYASLLRNEVNSRASERAAAAWERSGGGYDASADRAQRHTLALRDVAYIVRAQPLVGGDDLGEVAKVRDQFRRR